MITRVEDGPQMMFGWVFWWMMRPVMGRGKRRTSQPLDPGSGPVIVVVMIVLLVITTVSNPLGWLCLGPLLAGAGLMVASAISWGRDVAWVKTQPVPGHVVSATPNTDPRLRSRAGAPGFVGSCSCGWATNRTYNSAISEDDVFADAATHLRRAQKGQPVNRKGPQ